MDWAIVIEAADARVVVTTSGTMRLDDLRQMAADALEVATAAGIRRYLIDHRQVAPDLQTIDVHDLVDLFVEMGADAEQRVATVFASDAPGRDAFDYFHTRAHNRGAHQFRQFTDLEQARAWLASAP